MFGRRVEYINVVNKPEVNNPSLIMSAQITDTNNNDKAFQWSWGLVWTLIFFGVNAPIVCHACIGINLLHDCMGINAHRTELLVYKFSETFSASSFSECVSLHWLWSVGQTSQTFGSFMSCLISTVLMFIFSHLCLMHSLGCMWSAFGVQLLPWLGFSGFF